MARRRPSAGFTVMEVLVVVLIVAILAVFAVPNYRPLVESAQGVLCASRMRSIRLAMDHYLNDHEQIWPQAPSPEEERAWSDFWISTLVPYDITPGTWQCPSIRSAMRESGAETEALHYMPAMFDKTPAIARRWATQPWLIEVADAHGNGPLICFPDGSIKPLFKVLAEQGVR